MLMDLRRVPRIAALATKEKGLDSPFASENQGATKHEKQKSDSLSPGHGAPTRLPLLCGCVHRSGSGSTSQSSQPRSTFSATPAARVKPATRVTKRWRPGHIEGDPAVRDGTFPGFQGGDARGFTFLVYWITEKGVTDVAPSTWDAFQERVVRLYEQSAPLEETRRRIGQYIRRWKRWVVSGVRVRVPLAWSSPDVPAGPLAALLSIPGLVPGHSDESE